MLGIASYDSDEEEPAPKAKAAAPKPAVQAPPPKRARTEAPAVPKIAAAPKAAASKKLPEQKMKEIRKEMSSAKSATAVVQVIRRNLEESWDVRWGAEALYQVAKRSTARTRQEWAEDRSIIKTGDKLRLEAESGISGQREGDADTILLALEALRRMNLQETADQKVALQRAITLIAANNWNHPAKSLARCFWLGAPMSREAELKEYFDSKALPAQIRAKQIDLDGPDLALLLAAMRGEKGLKEPALLSKVVIRLKDEGIHKGLSATDLVEMAEALSEAEVTDQAALRPLGQEALRRRGELTPDESHRIHTAYSAMKLPLPQVWDAAGSTKTKHSAVGKVTTQAFALQEGHEKKRRGNNDIERTSPPRVVRDMKMCSY